MSIKIVTDSTCDLPQDVITETDISVVPLYINFGYDSFLDGVTLSSDTFYERLSTEAELPTTAAPSPADFQQVYERLVQEGATHIFSIHVASSLSATLKHAQAAAQTISTVPITVIDGGQLSFGTGILVRAAAQAVREGCDAMAIITLLNDLKPRTHAFTVLDDLRFLSRSGRASRLQAEIGTLLQINPVLTFHQGETSMERIRTKKQALKQLVAKVEALTPLSDIAILHTNVPSRAADLHYQLRSVFPANVMPPIISISPILATHLGPGAVGVACLVTS